jgi:hypothetical protein
MPVYATAALAVVVASFPVAFAFYSGPLGAEKARALSEWWCSSVRSE